MTIAVDFDGVIVEQRYPKIGREIPYAIEVLKMLQEEKHKLILWSVREGKLLDEAVEYCRKQGLEFYAINSNYAEEAEKSQHFSRKLQADMFIDARNAGGLPDWGTLYSMVHDGLTYEDILRNMNFDEEPSAPKGFWQRLFSLQ